MTDLSFQTKTGTEMEVSVDEQGAAFEVYFHDGRPGAVADIDAEQTERLAIALIQATPQPVYAPDPGGRFTREVALKIGLALIRLAKERP